MSIKSYSTSDYIQTKQGKIDGTVYTIRRMGAGDELDIAAISSRIVRLQAQIDEMKRSIDNAKTEEESMEAIGQNADALEKLAKEQANIERVYISLFDDGGDQSKSRELVHRLGHEGIKSLLNDIFGENDG